MRTTDDTRATVELEPLKQHEQTASVGLRLRLGFVPEALKPPSSSRPPGKNPRPRP